MPDRNQWNSAAVRLFDEISPYVLTGARRHEDWREDAIAVLSGEVSDPRGWLEYADREAWRACSGRGGGNAFPFKSLTADRLKRDLYEIEFSSAAQLLVILLDEWFTADGVWNLSERKEALLADARTLISRYGEAATFYTPASTARATRRPDFFTPPAVGSGHGGVPFSEFMYGDLGLVAVSDTEVGVFWAFNVGGD